LRDRGEDRAALLHLLGDEVLECRHLDRLRGDLVCEVHRDLSLIAVSGGCVWIAVAQAIYVAHFGYARPESIDAFVRQVLTSDAGHSMILEDEPTQHRSIPLTNEAI
jgi:hypothetical protein